MGDRGWASSGPSVLTIVDAAAMKVVSQIPLGSGLDLAEPAFVTPDGTMVAYAGKVVNADSVPPYVLDDPDRTIERFLFDTAGPHVPAQGLNIVADALTRA